MFISAQYYVHICPIFISAMIDGFFCFFERNDRRVLLYSHPMCQLFFASRVQTSTHPAIITSHNHEAPASLCISYAPNVLMAIGEQVVPAIQLAKADQRSAPLKTEN
jgi:hypothetical protein